MGEQGLGKPNRPRQQRFQRCQGPKSLAVPKQPTLVQSSGDQDGAYLQLIAQMKKSRDARPQSLKDVLEQHDKDTQFGASKQLHRAVSSQAQAKREIQSVRAARQQQYVTAWNEYVLKLCYGKFRLDRGEMDGPASDSHQGDRTFGYSRN